MLTVKEFKDLGVEFVEGDKRSSSVKGHGDVHMNKDMAYGSNNEAKTDHESIISFAWRPLNTLPDNPKFKYELGNQMLLWRPLLDQSQTETKEEKEVFDKMKPYEFDAHVSSEKPVFTQAMADAGELPPVGSEVNYIQSDGLVIAGPDCNDAFIILDDGEFEIVHYAHLKPIDTRTPKQKAVDELTLCILSAPVTIDSIGMAKMLYDAGYRKC